MMTIQQEDVCYNGFRDGDESALNDIYSRYYGALIYHGMQIVDDEFAVSCIVQEAFLKGWQHRESMENMRHIYCFIRLEVSWKCYAYLRNPAIRFHRSMVDYTVARDSRALEHHSEDTGSFNEERLKIIEAALPYLPPNRQTIMTLYFKYGMSCKKIAGRFRTSNQAISAEVQKSLENLKKIVHLQKKLSAKSLPVARTRPAAHTENMDAEMQEIFRLRYELKHSFEAIAEKMNISQGYVQQQYVIAHRRLRPFRHR
jgi:RNA polymerase sigma factor (sigma-70 family)